MTKCVVCGKLTGDDLVTSDDDAPFHSKCHAEWLQGNENMTLDEITRYAHKQADAAQVRLLQKANGKDVELYDDNWWQPVLDRIRFELNQHTGAIDQKLSVPKPNDTL